jgi:hypothetical protein
MKINPLAIQNYQQLIRRDGAPAQAPEDRIPTANTTDRVRISPQEETTGSKLAIKPPTSTFAESLTPDEQRALNLLFDRFGDTKRFGQGYRHDGDNESRGAVGRLLDVKV